MNNIVILDTGCANLASLYYAIQRLGFKPLISRDTATVLTASKLFLPGVGSANAAMAQLKELNLIELIKACTQPVLGICLGMQLLTNSSEEGDTPTLDIIHQPVKKMADRGLPLPHMGWNNVLPKAGHPLFRNINDHAYFYFVHGFALPIGADTIAETRYGDPFSAAVQKDNFFGVQFHPERSGKAGAQLLKNFLEM